MTEMKSFAKSEGVIELYFCIIANDTHSFWRFLRRNMSSRYRLHVCCRITLKVAMTFFAFLPLAGERLSRRISEHARAPEE
jgi:hypothetical protein